MRSISLNKVTRCINGTEDRSFQVLRFTDGDVKQNLEGVLHGIPNRIDEHGI